MFSCGFSPHFLPGCHMIMVSYDYCTTEATPAFMLPFNFVSQSPIFIENYCSTRKRLSGL